MKVTYETEDLEEQETLFHAYNFQAALRDMGNYLRLMALGKTDKIDDVEKINERFFDIMDDNGIDRDIVGF